MPYAANGMIGTSPIDGGIEITEAQYQLGLEGQSKGKQISIDGGFRVAFPADPEQEPPPKPTFEELKTHKLREIEGTRDAAINAGFAYTINGTLDHVQTRARDRENIMGLAVSAQNNASGTFDFRAESNTTYTLTAAEMIALADAAQQHVSAQYAYSWRLKAQVDDAQNEAGLEAIVWG